MDENLNWKSELIRIGTILKNNGIDISSIPTKGTKDGKRYFIALKDINLEGINIDEIIALNNLDKDWQIGRYLIRIRLIYKGTIEGNLSNEEKRIAEELGLVKIIPIDRKEPIYKGGKISDFHIDIVRKNIDKILSGELNNRETMDLINEEAIKVNESQIKDTGTVKRAVLIILADRPEELKKYNESLMHNIGKRNPYKGKIGQSRIGIYHQKELEFEKTIIEHYLPQIFSGEITFDTIENEVKTSRSTVEKVIKNYYLKSGDEEGLKKYEEAKRKNRGVSLEKRKQAQNMREEVAEYQVVSNAEFLLLSEEEQDRQIVMKIRQSKLQEEKNSKKIRTSVMTEEATIDRVQRIKQYFRSKNDLDNGTVNFSEQDIRHIIFVYPTIINRDIQTLDEKIDVLTFYDEIDEKTAFGMIKSFPAILGYDAQRTKAQLDLLKEENLIDYVIRKPNSFMKSVGLMYALIQFAKERHHTNDLTDINQSNIFMANSALKRLYGVTYEEIKNRFPYDTAKEEKDIQYSITGEDIGRATYKSVSVEQADEASKELKQLISQQKQMEGETDKDTYR